MDSPRLSTIVSRHIRQGLIMIDYIKENCELPPLNRPQFDEDSDTWDLYFTEKKSPDPYNVGGDDPICLAFETLEEASETLKQALELYHEENTQED